MEHENENQSKENEVPYVKRLTRYRLKTLSPNTPMSVIVDLFNMMDMNIIPYNEDGTEDPRAMGFVAKYPHLLDKKSLEDFTVDE